MANVLELLFNAASGGIVGTGMHLITDWVDTKNKIALMKAQTESAEKTEAWKAFTAAQTAQSTPPFQVPEKAWGWVQSVVAFAYGLATATKEFTRPGLTWAAVFFLVYVYHTASQPTRDAMTPEIQLGTWTAIFFWFGSRYTRK